MSLLQRALYEMWACDRLESKIQLFSLGQFRPRVRVWTFWRAALLERTTTQVKAGPTGGWGVRGAGERTWKRVMYVN